MIELYAYQMAKMKNNPNAGGCSWIDRISTVKNGYTTESNLHVQCNSHQNPNDVHHQD
jgi:hypothetical protein